MASRTKRVCPSELPGLRALTSEQAAACAGGGAGGGAGDPPGRIKPFPFDPIVGLDPPVPPVVIPL